MAGAQTKIIWNGQGPIDFGIYDPVNGSAASGYMTGLYPVGCGNRTLSVSLDTETNQIAESCSGQRLTLAELPGAKSMSVTLTMVQFDARTLARALMGDAVETAAGTVTGELLPQLVAGDIFYLKHPRVSSVVIVDSTGSPITYVAGTHYVVDDADHGRCRLIAHPASHVDPVKASYSHEASVNMATFSKANVETAIAFSGVNSFGQKGRLIIPRTSLKLSGDFGWITDGGASELTLSGQALYASELQNDSVYGGFARVTLMPDL